jgi:hypothetical protein
MTDGVRRVCKEARYLVRALKEMDRRFNLEPDDKLVEKMELAWLRRYVFLYKLHRRAIRHMVATKATEREIKRAWMTMDQVLAPLIVLMQSMYRRVLVSVSKPHEYVEKLWRGRPDPPWFITEEWFRWAEQEADEDILLDMDYFQRLNRGECPKPRPWMKK